MGAIIESVHTCVPRRLAPRHSSVALAARAGRRALRAAGCGLDEVGLLLNTGVYRDHHICEPAMAPLIQRAMGGRSWRRRSLASTTFSFDLSNGACGMLVAFQTADSLLRTQSLGRALVVTSDVDPTPRISEGCSFAPLGAAVLLAPGELEAGFVAFHFDTFVKHSDLLESRLDWDADGASSSRRTLRFTIREGDDLLERSVECATTSLGRFLSAQELELPDVDLVIASHHPAGFPDQFGRAVGIPKEQIAQGPDVSYTAGPAAGLEEALRDGRFQTARTALFVATGAGITVSLALYRSG